MSCKEDGCQCLVGMPECNVGHVCNTRGEPGSLVQQFTEVSVWVSAA